MPGLALRLITGTTHEVYFTSYDAREKFLASLTAMPGIIGHAYIELDPDDLDGD
jgi:hypothetical protein